MFFSLGLTESRVVLYIKVEPLTVALLKWPLNTVNIKLSETILVPICLIRE